LVKLIPGKVRLFCIRTQKGITDQENLLEPDEEKYVLDLDGLKNLDEFLARLKKKKRYNLKRDFKKIERQNPQIIYDRFEDLEELFKLNIDRFDGMVLGEDKSTFLPKEKQKTFREIINLANKYQIRMISVMKGQKVISVDLVAIYKDIYYCIGGACDIENYPGLGTFANLQLIKDAIQLGTKRIDFLQGDCNWKASWKMTTLPLFKYCKDA